MASESNNLFADINPTLRNATKEMHATTSQLLKTNENVVTALWGDPKEHRFTESVQGS